MVSVLNSHTQVLTGPKINDGGDLIQQLSLWVGKFGMIEPHHDPKHT